MPLFDDLKLQQILVNLLSNSVRYTVSGRIEATLAFDGERLEINVSDTGIGIGIAPEYHQRVFEPLNRGAQQGCEGAGLGLSIVKQLVDLMGGRLHLESAVSGGTLFTIVLPETIADDAKSPPPTLGDEPPLSLKNNNVLIVDDDPDICELLKWSLRDIGYVPEMLSDQAKVLARVDELKPGLILIDVDLGARSGLAITQELRLQNFPGAIVVFSGAADTRTRRAARKAGADAFLAKPLDLKKLLDWMRGLLAAIPKQS